MEFLHEKYGMEKDLAVMSSNFVYDTVRMASEAGFKKMLFAGHIGKLVKVAGGIKNTHSMYGDHRMEILSEITEYVMSRETDYLIHGTESTADYDNDSQKLLERIADCVMTDEAVRIIKEAGLGEIVFTEMAKRIKENMEGWSEGRLQVEIIVFANENTELVATDNAHKWAAEL
jgi:cobalt-precorrin-5B (C1)-methyltransferase